MIKIMIFFRMLTTTKALLYVQHHDQPFAEMRGGKKLKHLDKKIIECNFDFATQDWKFLRERTDKKLPNAYNTAVGRSC